MYEGQSGVRLDRKPTIGCRNEESLRDTERFTDEPVLMDSTPHMLKACIAKDNVKFTVDEGKRLVWINSYEAHTGKLCFEMRRALSSNAGDPVSVWIHLLEEV